MNSKNFQKIRQLSPVNFEEIFVLRTTMQQIDRLFDALFATINFEMQ